MAGVPGFEHVEGFGAADFADDDTIGPQAQGGAHQIGEAGNAGFCAERDNVAGGTAQLAGIFEDDDALVAGGDLGEQGIDERGFARRSTADDDDVLAVDDGLGEHAGLEGRHDIGCDVAGQAEQYLGRFAD